MTVTELRKELEAQGKGNRPVIWWDTYHGDDEPMHVDNVNVEAAPDPKIPWRLGFKTSSPEVVELG